MEEERLAICKHCGIFNSAKTQCNSHLALNPETNDVCGVKADGTPIKKGYKKGCGCYIPSKIKNPANHCPCGKW